MSAEIREISRENAYNRRTAPVLLAPTRPSPHHADRSRDGMADPQSIKPTRVARSGAAIHNWKGGRSVASNGYVLIRVGKDHHLADVRGYAYEHRLVAEQKLGRRLRAGEIPHHINGIKTDNRPENIEVVASQFEHRVRHRRAGKRRQNPHEQNRLIVCACGCGTMFAQFDETGRPRTYVSGHNPPREATSQNAVLEAMRDRCASRSDLRAATGLTVYAVSMALQHLKRKGLVRQAARGRWERAA
jgi:hypothetical protein